MKQIEMTLDEKIEELEKLDELASNLPWSAGENGPWGSQGFYIKVSENIEQWFCNEKTDNSDESSANAKLIHKSRNVLPELIAEYKRLKGENEQYEVDLNSPYCSVCGSCGIEDCCAEKRCHLSSEIERLKKFRAEALELIEIGVAGDKGAEYRWEGVKFLKRWEGEGE